VQDLAGRKGVKKRIVKGIRRRRRAGKSTAKGWSKYYYTDKIQFRTCNKQERRVERGRMKEKQLR